MIGICTTDGKGYWSTIKKSVTLTKLQISSVNKSGLLDSDHGELRVYFDPTTWEATTRQMKGGDGLIYTDKRWMREFRKLLISYGFSKEAVKEENLSYSEMGMQGVDYVSLDIGKEFLLECDKFFNFTMCQHNTIDIELAF
jgi:hypothetical protein